MKIAMLASGGVDSSVALKILKDQGYEVTAFYIKIWMEDGFSHPGKCPWEEDLKYIEQICDTLNVPLEIVPLQKEYWQRVVAEAIKEVKAGRTPNPDMLCNERIKFGVFYYYIGKEYNEVASGHYAQVEEADGKFLLKKSPDKIKDQTYFLARLSQEQLSKIIFPIGHLTKKEVRQLAEKFDLPNKDRKDSQGICFLGKIKYRDFLREHLGEKEGEIINKKTGEKMGKHSGFWYYTIGQRKDIKLSGGPWYVIDKDVEKNIIYIGGRDELKEEARDEFEAGKLHWISGRLPEKKNLRVKIRHGEKNCGCRVEFLDKNRLKVKMDEADKGVAAGQYAVFYDGEICSGSGIIN